MLFYFSLFAIIFCLLLLRREKGKISLMIVFGLLFLVYGCRNYGGVDDKTYILAFNNAVDGNIVYGMEESFLVISRLLGALGFNYKAIFLLYAFISFAFMFLAYKELCENKYDWMLAILGFFVFSFLPTLTVMRQFAAASIITYALTLKLKEKNKRALIFIGIAAVFHLGSLIGFILLPLFSIKLKATVRIMAPLVYLGIGYFGFFSKILNQFSAVIPHKYIGYVDKYASTTPHIGILHIILIVIYMFQFILPRANKTKEPSYKITDFLERTNMIYFSIYFITLSDGWISRLSIYFILFIPFVFKTFIARFALIRDKQMLYGLCYGAYVLLFMYQIINLPHSENMSELIPYHGSFNFRP